MMQLDDNVKYILDKLKEYGSIGYVVGGCIRDTFLGKEPDDWDICTPLLPEEIKEVFHDHQVIETGIKHGTVTVMISNKPYEITTFRIDGTYSDGRHPDKVNFTNKLKDDLKRRDFTINAMAYNRDVGLIDLYNGFNDIQNGIIRCVGNPSERFHEDGLRILRALRFAIALGFDIDDRTLYEMNQNSCLLDSVSKERVLAEMQKMMKTKFPHSFKVLHSCLSLFQCISSYFCDTTKTIEHNEIIESLIETDREDSFIVRMSLLLWYIDNPKELLRYIHLDNDNINIIINLLQRKDMLFHFFDPDDNDMDYFIRKLICEIGFRNTKYLLNLWKAKVISSCNVNKFKYLETINKMQVRAGIIITNNDCCTLKQLAVNGNDLISIGYKQDKSIGDVLKILLDEVMKAPFKNKKQWLLAWATEYLNERNKANETNK